MDTREQNYENHARFHPPFHFFLTPVLAIHLIWSVVRLVREPGFQTAEGVLLAIGLLVMAFLVRMNALRVQDRLICLEERLRYERILPAELVRKAQALTPSQVIALRFASDAELSERMSDVLTGRATKSREIKKSIRQWRPDTLRV